ncbi:hypothetical protein PIB30_094418, partial [Stylosanthes scabra]|nr:hypothetical protein [Stylosanthes scabra]
GADDGRILVTHALRSDISRCSRFISTHELWPTGIHRKAVFWITKAEVKMEFPSEFFDAFRHHFHSHIYLIDVKDNCLVLSVGKDDNSMWLPRESLCLIRNFYNLGYPTKLGLKYLGEELFFAVARDESNNDLEIMYQDKYVRDVLTRQKLKRIKELFKLDYNGEATNYCKAAKPEHVAASISRGVRATGDGETIELTVGNAYSTSSRVYLPINFARLILKAGIGSIWTVLGPTNQHKKLFKFKLVRNSSQRNACLFGGEWCDFCNAYRQSLNRKCQLKILSVEDSRERGPLQMQVLDWASKRADAGDQSLERQGVVPKKALRHS